MLKVPSPLSRSVASSSSATSPIGGLHPPAELAESAVLSQGEAWQAFLAYLNPSRVLSTLGLAGFAALLLSPIFATSFPVLLGRTLFVGLLGLLAFAAAGHWPRRLPKWLGRWLMQVLAVVLMVPTATLVVYLVAVGGDLQRLLNSENRIFGFLWIAGSGLLVAPLLAMGALYRQRDAEARSQALRFELERSELERQALDVRLRLLQAQVEPHFLFNTLANVRALVETGSPQAAPVLRSLIAYLRAAMPRLQNEAATLGDELTLVRAYLELMHLRMPDRLSFEIQLPQTMEALRFPPMALLTLVENAVRHGIDPSEEGGHIELGAAREGDSGPARLWVSDSGIGLQQDGGSGTGLRNLRERLKVFYPAGAQLTLSENSPHGLRAEIEFQP
ncbi:sensor histidine kinase [Paucibacter sp. DJ2R-2]|uniref:sensor histidine kinase n=1 Tax=Paucibacter sp. DJ2R-2 TaxID=2893558 RepID=UPI0021E3BE90|nr:histidine kinase [Paucibacter sp. DJ2R-2]MCV2422664.1 histidine kinase [Paucibacter sp. DJ4R-1]MCV2438862.1 histidine kinase [Paucibacter sp. DJ2R-2]